PKSRQQKPAGARERKVKQYWQKASPKKTKPDAGSVNQAQPGVSFDSCGILAGGEEQVLSIKAPCKQSITGREQCRNHNRNKPPARAPFVGQRESREQRDHRQRRELREDPEPGQ